MNWKQFLTEKVLREPEAASEYIVANNGDLVSVKTVIKNHTFDNRNDLLDLYEAIYRDGKWDKLEDHLFSLWDDLFPLQKDTTTFTPWLFCLDGKGYEDRCKMVAEFYGWEGEK